MPSIWPSTARASSRSRCRTARSPTPATVPSSATVPARSSPRAATRSRRPSPFRPMRSRITISRDGIVSVTQAGHGDADAGRQHPAGQLRQSRRTAEHRRKPVRRNRILRYADTEHPGHQWHRPAQPGLCRNLQRQCGRGTGDHDPDAARLRNEFEGGHHLGSDAGPPDSDVRIVRLHHETFALPLAPPARGPARRLRHHDAADRRAPADDAPVPSARHGAPRNNGAIYNIASARPLFEDRRARFVGDTITINIAEKTAGVEEIRHQGRAQPDASLRMPTMLGLPCKSLPGHDARSEQQHSLRAARAKTSSGTISPAPSLSR